jgi:hypothetical protein
MINRCAKTHEWLGAPKLHISAKRLPAPTTGTFNFRQIPRRRRAPASLRAQHVVLVAGHVLVKLAVAAIPIVIIVTVSVATIAAFVGGYLAAFG